MSIWRIIMAARDKNRPPVHPGEILREDVLPGLGMSVTKAAEALGLERTHLHKRIRHLGLKED